MKQGGKIVQRNKVWQVAVRYRMRLLLLLVTISLGFSLIEHPEELRPATADAVKSGYLIGRVLLENGEVAQGTEVFFKVQKAFGASCYSKECDSFQNAIFRDRLTVAADGSFEIRIPQQFMNSAKAPLAYVYTVVVRTPAGKYRPFYAFKISHEERVVNDFVLRPPFLDTAPGGEDEIVASSDLS
jgi:hypothetical protein